MTAMLPHALRYYDSGLSVIPDKPKDKRPDLPEWECFTHERASRQTLVYWWQQKPSRNIGVVTGEVSGGLVCLDFDAIKAFDCYCAEFPNLLSTRIHLSGSRKGYHAFYYVAIIPKSEAFNASFGRVEVRANGMQVVAPPSIHPSGNPYTVHARQSTLKVKDVAAVVDWLKFNTPTLQTPHTPSAFQATPANLSNKTNDFILHGASVGERNARLFRAACDCVGNGLAQGEAESLLVGASGLPTIEAQRTVASAYKAQRGAARDYYSKPNTGRLKQAISQWRKAQGVAP